MFWNTEDGIIRKFYFILKLFVLVYKMDGMSKLTARLIILRHSFINNSRLSFYNNKTASMVKVQDFQGAVFNPEDYGVYLHNNIEHLESVPMSKSFSTAAMLS